MTKYITPEQLGLLAYFEVDIDGETWRKLFVENGGTKNMAEHLWEKFHTIYNHSILRLWINLDINNRTIVLKILNTWKGRYT